MTPPASMRARPTLVANVDLSMTVLLARPVAACGKTLDEPDGAGLVALLRGHRPRAGQDRGQRLAELAASVGQSIGRLGAIGEPDPRARGSVAGDGVERAGRAEHAAPLRLLVHRVGIDVRRKR